MRVFDLGTTGADQPYIVMELLEGEDLASLLGRRGRIEARRAVASMMPVADALSSAHAKGIVHRDIKPENIFFAETEGGGVQPKLIDFGVAKLDQVSAARLTHGGMVGSPAYASPEQMAGGEVDFRADVWGFSVVLYEMVTGGVPFGGRSWLALVQSVMRGEPPPITAYGAGDAELWAIVERGLEKDPADRWGSMYDLGSALASWLMSHGIAEDIRGTLLEAAWAPRSSPKRDAFGSLPPREPLHDVWMQLVQEHVPDSAAHLDHRLRATERVEPVPPTPVPRRAIPPTQGWEERPTTRAPTESGATLGSHSLAVLVEALLGAEAALARGETEEAAVGAVDAAVLADASREPRALDLLGLAAVPLERCLDAYLSRHGSTFELSEQPAPRLTFHARQVLARHRGGRATLHELAVGGALDGHLVKAALVELHLAGLLSFVPGTRVLVVDGEARSADLAVDDVAVEIAPSCSRARTLEGAFDAGIFDSRLPDGSDLDLARELLLSGSIARAVFFARPMDAAAIEARMDVGHVIIQQGGLSQLREVVRRVAAGGLV